MLVFDSSTLILLARIEILELFIVDFQGDIIIPERVKYEVTRKNGEENILITRLIKDRKMKVLKVRDGEKIKKLMEDFNIDRGEAEAIVLAMQKGCRVVATDDRNAIRACKFLKIDFVTALTFLIRAFEKGLIDRDIALAKLTKLKFIGRYSEGIIKDALKKIKGGGQNGDKNTEHTHG